MKLVSLLYQQKKVFSKENQTKLALIEFDPSFIAAQHSRWNYSFFTFLSNETESFILGNNVIFVIKTARIFQLL